MQRTNDLGRESDFTAQQSHVSSVAQYLIYDARSHRKPARSHSIDHNHVLSAKKGLKAPTTMKRGEAFANLVHRALISDRKIETTAAKIGMGYDKFYSRIRNRTCFSADEIRELIKIIPDRKLVGYLFEGTAYQPADRLDPVKTPKANLWHAAHRVVVEAATVLNSLEAALADNRIDHREAAALQADIEEAERALATIREAVKSLGRG